ncbi:hypothetical protein FPV67DRAFT_1558550 [Lyophyllum atratum]|nr:hypothetical protein FPV67DRAFT_1558550 [Lyophyllum atratum]
MLPKVATHILHTTSRAAASIQHQTHTIRNVLQLQSSSGPSSSSGHLGSWNGPGSSYWGNNGPSPGGAKYTGSRYHNGFTGAGRAVTQANATMSSNDGSRTFPTQRASIHTTKRTRIRSHSLSTPNHGRAERAENLGVLKTVQQHTRARHVFAPQSSTSQTSAIDDSASLESGPRPVLVRRNSTSAPLSTEAFDPSIPAPSPVPQDPASKKSTLSEDSAAEAAPSTHEFNLALDALQSTRRPGEPLHLILETYNDMLRHSLLPNASTLTARDIEVQRVIHTLETRLKHRKLTGREEIATEDADKKRIEALRGENNYASAMSLFEAILSINANNRCPVQIIDGAIHRANEFRPTPSAYTNAGQLKGAEEAIQRAELHINWSKEAMIETYFRFNLPDKAVGLVDEMMRAEADPTSLIADPPPTGDVATALVWFDRLLQQMGTSEDPFETTGVAMKPDTVAWSVMLDALAVQGMIHDLNRLFVIRLKDDPNVIRHTERMLIWTMDFLHRHVGVSEIFPGYERVSMIKEIMDVYLERKMYDRALTVLSEFVSSCIGEDSLTPIVAGRSHYASSHSIETMQLSLTKKLYEATQGNVPYTIVMQLARIADSVRIMQQAEYIPFFLQAYALSRKAGTLPTEEMTLRDWELLMYAAVEVEIAATSENPLHTAVPEYAFEGVVSLLADLSHFKVAFNEMNAALIRRTMYLILQQRGREELEILFKNLGPSFQAIIEDPDHALAAFEQAVEEVSSEASQDSGYASAEFNYEGKLRIDPYLTKTVQAELRAMHNPGFYALTAFAKFRQGVENGTAPAPGTIGFLIQTLGRTSRLEEVHYAYTVAQSVLASLETNKAWQADAWFIIEDSMIIALAHSGDVEGAHVHRRRILEQGGSPTADAYGALIYNVKDTTDDTSNAMTLFQESQAQRVVPNQFLYNNIISKLAKARKADYALELFQQMKSNSVVPSSVTYGAVIGACARVGDVHSAEMLFSEMTQAKNFKPRIPPYNTMMQLYTTTKPDRERALYFYHEMRRANIHPTAHTYKLLMDAYGAIEPVDIETMERTFKTLQEDPSVQVQGNHFASLINAYGCVQKDLNKAIDVFNSIPTYPGAPPADALVFEAMINALVAHRRTDLIPGYIAKMEGAGVHMTAYIGNFLIKGYAMVGDMEQARRIFEALEDPLEGMAAPNNHAPHEPSSSPAVEQSAPVYREPSTWEAMIRAELGSGNRQGALDLLERLKARQYPEAVYNRISGILVDHSQVLP